MSHKGTRCVVMSHKGVWSEACGIVWNCARNEDVGGDLHRDMGQFHSAVNS